MLSDKGYDFRHETEGEHISGRLFKCHDGMRPKAKWLSKWWIRRHSHDSKGESENFDAKSASVIRPTSANGTDENTINNPTNVYPVEETLTPSADCVIMDVPANSLNILKVQGKSNSWKVKVKKQRAQKRVKDERRIIILVSPLYPLIINY